MTQFKIGVSTAGADFKTLQTWFATADFDGDPDATHQPYSDVRMLGDGTNRGVGFAIVKWRWKVIPLDCRYILRSTFCAYPNLSAENIYIYTPISDTNSDGTLKWATFRSILHWPNEDEDYQAAKELDLLLTFTHLVLIP